MLSTFKIIMAIFQVLRNEFYNLVFANLSLMRKSGQEVKMRGGLRVGWGICAEPLQIQMALGRVWIYLGKVQILLI